MGDGGFDTPAFGKSVRSFAEALGSLEKEVEMIFERARTESAGGCSDSASWAESCCLSGITMVRSNSSCPASLVS